MAIRSIRVTSVGMLCLLVPFTLIAQERQDIVPLKNWPAPLYWQPSVAEDHATPARVSASEEARLVSADYVTPKATTPLGALVFVAMTPCRVVDTRTFAGFSGAFGPPSLVGGSSRTFPIQSSTTCSIPSVAQAYSFNVTVVPQGATFPGNVNPSGALGFLTIWPSGIAQPSASTLNSWLGTVAANAAIVPTGTNGSVDVFASNNTDLIIDINGYYAPQTGITLAQGTAAAPSVSFAGDPGTGIYSSGAGALNLSTGGANRVSVDPNGDLTLTANLNLPNTTGSTAGVLTIGGVPFLHSYWLENTFVGKNSGNFTMHSAGGFFDTGGGNTAIGNNAMANNNTGDGNTAIGLNSLELNSDGEFNVAVGYDALPVVTVGGFNTAAGTFALRGTTGGGNTGIGGGALGSNTTGSFNTAVGFNAGQTGASTTGSNNTFIGHSASQAPTELNNATAIGANAFVAASNALVLGDSTVSVGIGTSAPLMKLQVVGDIRVGTSGTNGCIQDFNGDALVGTCSSDERLKQNVEPFSSVLDKLVRLQPVSYEWRTDDHPEYHFGSGRTSGLIAQDVEKVFPDMVSVDEHGYKTVNYSRLPLLFLQAVRELKAENDELRREESLARATSTETIQREQAQRETQQKKIEQQQIEIDQLKQLVCVEHPLAEVCR